MAVWVKTDTTLFSDSLQHYLLMGDATKYFNISLSEGTVFCPATETMEPLKSYTQNILCAHTNSTAN
jgi:hypothetical protein